MSYIVFAIAAVAMTYVLILAGIFLAGWCDRWID